MICGDVKMVEELLGNIKGPKGDTGPTGPTGPAGGSNLKTSFLSFNHELIQYINYDVEIPKYSKVSGILKGVNANQISLITGGQVHGYIGNPAKGGSYAGYSSVVDSNGEFYVSLINQLNAKLMEVYAVFNGNDNYCPVNGKTYVLAYKTSKNISSLTSSYTIYSGDNLSLYYASNSNVGDVMAVKLNSDNQLEQGVGAFSQANSGLGFYVNYNYLWGISNGTKQLIASGVPLGPNYTMVVSKYGNYSRIMFFDGNDNPVFSCDSDIATFPTTGNVGAIGTKNNIYF